MKILALKSASVTSFHITLRPQGFEKPSIKCFLVFVCLSCSGECLKCLLGYKTLLKLCFFFWVTCSFNASPMRGGDLGLNGDMHLEKKKNHTSMINSPESQSTLGSNSLQTNPPAFSSAQVTYGGIIPA